MRQLIQIAAIAAVLVFPLQAQSPAQAEGPIAADVALASKELITAYAARDLALGQAVQARLEAMLRTPEGQAYQAVLKDRESARASIQQKVSAVFPGHAIDFTTGRLIAKSAPATK